MKPDLRLYGGSEESWNRLQIEVALSKNSGRDDVC